MNQLKFDCRELNLLNPSDCHSNNFLQSLKLTILHLKDFVDSEELHWINVFLSTTHHSFLFVSSSTPNNTFECMIWFPFSHSNLQSSSESLSFSFLICRNDGNDKINVFVVLFVNFICQCINWVLYIFEWFWFLFPVQFLFFSSSFQNVSISFQFITSLFLHILFHWFNKNLSIKQ